MAPTWSLPARPDPVIAALTSLGVCRLTGTPRRPATSIATPAAWAVPITVCTLCWAKTRSIATAVGPVVGDPGVQRLLEQHQPAGRVELGRRAHHVDGDQPRLAAGQPVHHPESTAGQAGVDAQHPHEITPKSCHRTAHAILLAGAETNICSLSLRSNLSAGSTRRPRLQARVARPG